MPTARQHTIILHGGSRDAKTSRTQIALKHYEDVLANRMKCIMAETAKAVYEWQVPGTSIVKDGRPRWSGAFRANWQIKIGGYSDSGWLPDKAPNRYPWDWNSDTDHAGEYMSLIYPSLAEKTLAPNRLANMAVTDAIYVGNVSPYAHWLNYGGELPGTFITDIFGWLNPGHHFMEKCEAYIRSNVNTFIDRGLAAAAKKPARG